MSNSEDIRTVVLVKVASEWQATLIADLLRDRGIDAVASGGLTGDFRAEGPGNVRVIVPHTQLEEARKALAESREEASEIDWSQIDVGEPE